LIYNICADDETVPTLKAAPELCSEAFIVKWNTEIRTRFHYMIDMYAHCVAPFHRHTTTLQIVSQHERTVVDRKKFTNNLCCFTSTCTSVNLTKT
jgi:hypothetical protein